MLDAEDRAILALWGIRALALMLAIFATSATLGAAWRLFEFLRG